MANVDCLVCHDTTGLYSKNKNKCGYPDKDIDLAEIAKKVGMPGRGNCGACHWHGGGGDNFKHGDLGSELLTPSRSFDVHMGGENFTCQECHTTDKHRITGSSTTTSVSEGAVACIDCHDKAPHDEAYPLLSQLNSHCESIACQTCHIPTFARKQFTLTYRDNSRDIGPAKILKQSENKIEMQGPMGFTIKEKELRPVYAWYNGKHRRYLKADKVDLKLVIELNPPEGSIKDPLAKIFPFKLMKSRQPADPENRSLIVPHLTGPDGFFANGDWKSAAEKGMKAAKLPFSGKIAFAETSMYWRLNHGVVPKDAALSCLDCHSPSGVMDFKALGYDKDPANGHGRSMVLAPGNNK